MNQKIDNDEHMFLKDDKQFFNVFSIKVAEIIGNVWTFTLIFTLTVGWLILGPFLNFSENWQNIANIVPSIVTLLIVFSIQNSQNRETKAIQLKLNELIRALKPAQNPMMDLSKLSDEQLKELEQKYKDMCQKPAQ